MGTRSQELFGAGLWSKEAAEAGRRRGVRDDRGGRGGFALQRVHPDRVRWLTIRRFASQSDAHAALEAVLKNGEDPSTYRIVLER
jgi:hypothetical protein